MKLSAAILITSATAIQAFSPISNNHVRKSAVKPLNYGWDEYQKALSGGGGAPAPAPAAQPPSYAAPPAPAAAPPAAPQQPDDDVPMSNSWASKVDYDPSQDKFPTFPPGYRTFDEIWAEFKANKAAGMMK